ncbi:hypothetical protein HMPREF1378_00180 [Enterococcus faecium R496]|uniref:Uncharacterized protein n=2 Tax=Enterococcus faecium TaxID=1352 RepID=A0AB73A651_ENTFC|nr:hypothetical protein HMPREF1382_00822 [Enterococcus faecium S447]EJX45698.1 hypothetical protein HMPREF1381_00448 [Enterococcus faecium R501]EJX55948.1 hypothetical protein HMPREF1378_00180 [Enterococcus faecium R496]EJX65139.1 hypothetical protein HMPREF1376_00433 [Enterococcus faecium R446]EJX82308.1 hypothetical protein HMPREF1369_01021 [Enterococcus faecium ERV99]EJX91566.1 hypothetical protein HMPREF1366_02163 [Enterococcus faecium ERV26]EJX95065.1 hypothetical protein HMPREF1365_0150
MQIFGIGLVFSMYGSFCVYPTLASSLASSENRTGLFLRGDGKCLKSK